LKCVAPVITAQPVLPKCTNRTTEDEALQFHASGPLIKMAKIDADRVKAAAGIFTGYKKGIATDANADRHRAPLHGRSCAVRE
jgi:hypothetical protein